LYGFPYFECDLQSNRDSARNPRLKNASFAHLAFGLHYMFQNVLYNKKDFDRVENDKALPMDSYRILPKQVYFL